MTTNDINSQRQFVELSKWIPAAISASTTLVLILSVTFNFFYFKAIDFSLLGLLTLSDYLASALRHLPFIFAGYFAFDIARIELAGASKNKVHLSKVVGKKPYVFWIAWILQAVGVSLSLSLWSKGKKYE